MPCTECSGAGCEWCTDGRFEVKGCPGEWCGGYAELIRMARFARRGAWPVLGGTLDQTQWCVTAFGFIDAEERAWRKPESTS